MLCEVDQSNNNALLSMMIMALEIAIFIFEITARSYLVETKFGNREAKMTMRIDRETEHNCPMKHSVGSHYLICKSPIENMMSAGGVAAHRPSSNLSAQALETRAAKMPASQHRSNSNSVSLLMRELCVETLTFLASTIRACVRLGVTRRKIRRLRVMF